MRSAQVKGAERAGNAPAELRVACRSTFWCPCCSSMCVLARVSNSAMTQQAIAATNLKAPCALSSPRAVAAQAQAGALGYQTSCEPAMPRLAIQWAR
jgi:hypothetical protein